MTQPQKDLVYTWKQARIAQIRKLRKEGVPEKELVNRFGSRVVSQALCSQVMYN